MCEKCEEKFQQLDPKVLMALDKATPEFVALIDKLVPELGTKLTGMTMGSFNTETGEVKHLRIDELPQEVQDEFRPRTERYARNIAATILTAYVAFRYADGPEEAAMMSMAMPMATDEAAIMGQLVRKHVEMLSENGGLN